MTDVERALAVLRRFADPERAAQMQVYHKTERETWGVSNPQIDEVVKASRTTPERDVSLARELWDSGVFEARIAAGKLLVRGRLGVDDDQAVWRATMSFAPDFDGWAIADTMASAAHKRILVRPDRYLELEPWTDSEHLWTKRAAMVYTLPLARLKAPAPQQALAIETVLAWAAEYTTDPEWFIQKSVGWWLRELSKRNPARVREFLVDHGAAMKPFARREATKYL